jgi:pimeloyl-ACP methyl ester carboxylesterase
VTEYFLRDRGIYFRTNDLAADRPTLLFVHGISGSSSAWRPYEARFGNQYNVIALDLRGHGRSMRHPRFRDYEVGRFVEDLQAVIDATGIDRCVFVSHSFAVLLTLEFLRTRSDCVDGLVLVSGAFNVGRVWHARVAKPFLAATRLLELMPLAPGAGVHIDYGLYPESSDWDLARTRADIRNTTWRTYLFCSRAIYAVQAEPLLAQIRVPVLLVHGRRDSIFSVENSKFMAARIPTAELVIIEDGDHIVVLNRPLAVGDAIETFLRSRAHAAA